MRIAARFRRGHRHEREIPRGHHEKFLAPPRAWGGRLAACSRNCAAFRSRVAAAPRHAACAVRRHTLDDTDAATDEQEEMMGTATIATLATVWDCRFSRPGYRLTGVAEADQPETTWVCVREGERRPVSDEECRSCPHWQPEETRA